MKILFIGGTGNISGAASRQLLEQGHQLFHLNRGQRPSLPGATVLVADIKDPSATRTALGSHQFDVVVNWIAYKIEDVERDIAVFRGRTAHYIFISSASVYEKPPRTPFITEATPLHNPYWVYSQEKIQIEDRLQRAFRDENFPMTIVRPAHTYDTIWPIVLGGAFFTYAARIRRGDPIIVHGDGTSLWCATHSDDFARGFNGLLGHPAAIGRAFHITSHESVTWNQIYQTMGAALGREPNVVHIPSSWLIAHEPSLKGPLWGDKAHSVIFDNTAIQTLVPGFRAQIPLHIGLKRTAAWFDADPKRQQINPDHESLLQRCLAAWKP